MTTALTIALIAAALYAGKRWNDARLENSRLREQITALKRQLGRRPL
jgi:hypothetical protein